MTGMLASPTFTGVAAIGVQVRDAAAETVEENLRYLEDLKRPISRQKHEHKMTEHLTMRVRAAVGGVLNEKEG